MALKNSGESATKADLKTVTGNLKTELQADIKITSGHLRSEIKASGDQLRSEIKASGDQLRSEIKASGDQLRSEIKASGDQLRAEIIAVETRLDKKIERVAIEVVRTRDEMATKVDVADIKKHLNEITNTLDTISGQCVDNRNTLLIYSDIFAEDKKILASHDKRLSVLESKL